MDHLSPQQRRHCMQANRSRGTKPELLLARELWQRGLRYRKNLRGVPGSPDLCFKGRKVAVFVDGEFWHGRNWEETKLRIKSRRDYWWPKIERNREHDEQVNRELAGLGWRVLRFWESQVRHDVAGCADCIEEALRCETLEHLHRIYAYDTRYDDLPDLQAAEEELEYGK